MVSLGRSEDNFWGVYFLLLLKNMVLGIEFRFPGSYNKRPCLLSHHLPCPWFCETTACWHRVHSNPSASAFWRLNYKHLSCCLAPNLNLTQIFLSLFFLGGGGLKIHIDLINPDHSEPALRLWTWQRADVMWNLAFLLFMTIIINLNYSMIAEVGVSAILSGSE